MEFSDPAKLFGLPVPVTAELSDTLHVPYLDTGSGELLMLVHGSLCDMRYWKPQIAPLSAHYRCVAPSLPHYWPAVRAHGDEFSWSRHVDELAELIAHLDPAGAHVVGHSRGGCVAFHLAARYPQLVRTLTLADPGGPLQQKGETAQVQLPETVNALRAKAVGLIADGEVDAGLGLFVDSVSAPGFWKKSTTEFRAMAADNAHTLALQFRDPLPAYSAQSAADIRCPTLLIDGEKSPRMFRKNAEALHEWIADARRATVTGASHGMNVAHPSAFNRYVLEFVRAAQG